MKGPRESQASWDYWSYEKTAVDTPHHPDTKRFSHFSKSSFSLSSSLSLSLSQFSDTNHTAWQPTISNMGFQGYLPKPPFSLSFKNLSAYALFGSTISKYQGSNTPTVLQCLKQPYLDLFRRVGRHFCLSKTAGLYISLSLVSYMICM